MTQIVLENLFKQYPRQPVPTLQGISLEVPTGEMLALLGPSGSGKSTILKLIAGIETLDRGDICLDGRSIVNVPANQRGTVLMFQKAYLFPYMTVADNIGFGLKVQKASKKTIRAEVARMLELVELPGVERKYPQHLSGGEQQRVALARALVTRPQVLMLDEPLSSLDTAVRYTLQESIRRIQREMNITTLLVTHDLTEAVTMADRIALLLDGAIEACDQPQQLFQRPPTRSAAQFVGVSTFLEGTLDGAVFSSTMGQLGVPAQRGSAAARPAVLAIRPEHLRVLDAPAPNTLSGTVRDVVYRGEFSEYQVAVGAQAIRVREYQQSIRHTPGSEVHVQFAPEWLFEVRTSPQPTPTVEEQPATRAVPASSTRPKTTP